MLYNILIADDEPEITELLQLYLEQDYKVITARDGLEAISIVQSRQIDLAILDIMMPGIDGLQLIKKIREAHQLPVLFLSAKSQHHDKILGLGLGADDYISKPFNPLEVVARAQALLRRVYHFDAVGTQPQENEKVIIGELILDRMQCKLMCSGREVLLTSTEYKIVSLLLEQPGRVFTRKKIYESVWEDYYAHEDSTIMMHISNIREKIERDPKQPVYLKTIRGLGYKIEAPMEL
ncbi:response regulator transcription factor [Paenibacillus sp. IHBB 10380]|uniref:response regulator transcription factor n=1 Tax=Paenibacillus sp. IHBB 10380 TaxID=1566358 RepID=UPI0005CFC923|nr:response regulator transcription factor [Paenibacillus sp. IHBB 10380]AJS58831.1 PhoP family transcriptional regulator [Paenibacillus sp. IHBB 10380]